jgi:photosystem II stability/assembly factor-like uncharacterized protein
VTIASRVVLAGLLLALLPVGASTLYADQSETTGPSEWSVVAPKAATSLLLDGVVVDDLIVVVGSRGHILTSADRGVSWQQQPVPTRAMLTGVFFHDTQLGWAVGHDADILRTHDGGKTWQRVHHRPDEQRPLLDIWFSDDRNGLAVGAYGYYLTTNDAGDSWTARELYPPGIAGGESYEDFFDFHLNHISRSATGRLYIAAEAGTILRSDDGGQTWSSLPSPYTGSFSGTLPLEDDSLLLFGLRGNLFRSENAGESWTRIPTNTVALLTDALKLSDGTLVITGMGGILLVSKDGGQHFSVQAREDRQGLSTILETPDNTLILVGEYGVQVSDRANW